MTRSKIARVAVATVLASGISTAASAQTAELTPEEYLAYLQNLSQQTGAAVAPAGGVASTVGIPGGYTLPSGAGFAAFALSNQREQGSIDSADGGVVFGFGLGDARNAVGVEALINITSVDTSDFGDSGTIDFKASRILSQTSSVSLGVNNVITWGDSDAADLTYSVAYTKNFMLGSRAAVGTVGYSTATGTGGAEEAAFAGIGVSVAKNLSVGLSLAGNEWRGGATYFTRMFNHDAQIGLSYDDIAQKNSDGRWTLSVAIIEPQVLPFFRGR